jgi:hypothetical protein
MSLTPEQKDQAFGVFSKLNTAEADDASDGFNPAKFIKKRSQRIDALKPILTPEQLSLYERSAPQADIVLGGEGIGGIIGSAISIGGAEGSGEIISTQVINIDASDDSAPTSENPPKE